MTFVIAIDTLFVIFTDVSLVIFIDITKPRGVAQLVARDVWDVDAAGSNPVTPTMASVLTAFEML